MDALGRMLIALGVVFLILGVLLVAGPQIPWLGKLPGDIRIARPGLRIYVPITTCLLLSAVVSGVLWLLGRFR
jgi:hypothetical protein